MNYLTVCKCFCFPNHSAYVLLKHQHFFFICSPCSSFPAALVPDSVKKELLQRIRAFLAQHATLWMRRFPSRHFFTHRRSTIKFQTDVCSHCEQCWSVIFYFVLCVFILIFSLLCSVFWKDTNKVMPILVIGVLTFSLTLLKSFNWLPGSNQCR